MFQYLYSWCQDLNKARDIYGGNVNKDLRIEKHTQKETFNKPHNMYN